MNLSVLTNNSNTTIYTTCNDTSTLNLGEKVKFIVVLLCIFFLPIKNEWFRYYTLINTVLPIILLSDIKRINTQSFKLIVYWGIFFLVVTCSKIFFIPSLDLGREFTEFFRILIIIPFILANNKYFSRSGRNIFYIIAIIYVVFDTYLTLIEIRLLPSSEFYIFIRNNYYVAIQADKSYLAKGLSSHGAIHAVIMNFFIIFFMCHLSSKKNVIINCIMILLCSYNMLNAGSRTCLIGFFVFIISYFLINIFKNNGKIPFPAYFITILVLLFVFVLISSGNFYKLQLLFERGTDVSSFAGRQNNWNDFIAIMIEYWYMLFIGWGKTIFIEKTSFFTDNDYFTYLIVHGLVVFVILIGVIIKLIITTLKQWTKYNIYNSCLLYFIIFTTVVSLSSAGFSLPIVLLLLTLFYRFAKKYHEEEFSINNR